MTPVGSKAIVLNESSGVPSLKPLSKLVHLCCVCSEVVLTFFAFLDVNWANKANSHLAMGPLEPTVYK